MSWLVLLFGLLLPAASQASESPVKLELSPTDPEVGLVMELRVVMEGELAADARLLEIPNVEGARLQFISGPKVERITRRVNARRTEQIKATWRIELVPERSGLIQLPAFPFEARGERIESAPASFAVAPVTIPADAVEIEITPSARELYIGEMVELEVRASVLESLFDQRLTNGLQLELPWLDELIGFHRRPSVVAGAKVMQPIQPSGIELPIRLARDSSGPSDRVVISTVVPLVATEAGFTALEGARLTLRVASETEQQRDFFRGNRTVATRIVELASPALDFDLNVRPAPTDGRPDGYTNAVGAFVLDALAEPRKLAVGDSCRLTLRLRRSPGRPEGNLELLDWPAFEDTLADFRIFGKEAQTLDGVRVLSFEISPRRDDVSEIPVLELAAFDPREARYRVLRTEAIPLEVASGGGAELVSMATREERQADLESIRVELPVPAQDLPWWWIAPCLGGLTLLGAELVQRRRSWRGEHGEVLRQRGARRQLEERLADVEDAAAVASAFARFLSARLGGPEAGYTSEEAATRLSDDGLGELANDVRSVMQNWEAAYLGGGQLSAESAAAQARELADRVERLA